MPSKEKIIYLICKLAFFNGGTPVGMDEFERKTGIRRNNWQGKYWSNWSEAVHEAAWPTKRLNRSNWSDANSEAEYSTNRFDLTVFDERYILENIIQSVRKIGHFPSWNEIKKETKKRVYKGRRHHSNSEVFIASGGFVEKIEEIGTFEEVIRKLVDYCGNDEKYRDILQICRPLLPTVESEKATYTNDDTNDDIDDYGVVYLLKFGKYYKIGRSNDVKRRMSELKIQLPESPKLIHEILTDDPSGIEAYWHRRFTDKRKGGEWFELDRNDVRAFKRKNFM